MGHVFVELSKGVEHTDLDGKTFDAVVTAGKVHVEGLTWQELALYNWGTAEPTEVNRALRETIGCSAVDDADPSKTALAVKKGPTTTAKPRLPKLWTQDGLAANQTHTIKVKRRMAPPAVAITELTAWFLPTTGACEVKYRLEGIEGRADKLDFEVHASGYYELNKGGGQVACDTTADKGSTHIYRKGLTPDLKSRAAQTFGGWKGESQATKGVLTTISYDNNKADHPHAAHHCAPYTVLLRYRKDDADKASIVLRPFTPVWKPAAADPTDESLVVEWALTGDDKRKLTRGLLFVHDKDGKVVFSAGLDRAALEGGKYDLAKDARNPWPKASVKKAELPYRVQLQAHSESDVEEGLALAAMHTLVRANLYTKVQFVGCNIRPGYTDTTPKKYLGEADAVKDIKKRAAVMAEAIDLAAKDAKINKDADVLKVFMAPEFYWRGVDGAYPAEKLDSIIDELRPETSKPQYVDWLFVYGTAIGYLPHEEVNDKGVTTGQALDHRVVHHPGVVDHVTTIKKVTTADVTTLEIDSTGAPSQADLRAAIVTAAPDLKDEVTACKHLSETVCELTLKGATAFVNGAVTVQELRSTVTEVIPGVKTKLKVRSHLCRKGGMHVEEAWKVEQSGKEAIVESHVFSRDDEGELTLDRSEAFAKGPINFIYDPALVTSVVGSTVRVRSRLCSRIPAVVATGGGKAIRWSVRQGGVTAEVSACVSKGDADFELTLIDVKGGTIKANQSLTLIEPKTSEVLNVAFVQKGWPAPTAKGELRQVVVYKENVSHIDYMSAAPKPTVTFHDGSGLGRAVVLHGDPNRIILPTDGAKDVLGASPNDTTKYVDVDGQQYVVGSEVNLTGAGGGGVFTIDGVTFGMEVCRDHLVGRLRDFYKRAKKNVDPRVQVLLVPSWGAWLQASTLESLPNAPLFNVDGARADSVVRVNDGKWSCEKTHPQVNKADDSAPCDAVIAKFRCPPCKAFVGTDKASAWCRKHGQVGLEEYRVCAAGEVKYRCPLCRNIADVPGSCCLWLARKAVHQCRYETPYYYCTQCKAVKATRCMAHGKADNVEMRKCVTCGSRYTVGSDCNSGHRKPEGKCGKYYLTTETCSDHGATPVPCDVLYKVSVGHCPDGHAMPKTCGVILTKIGTGKKPATAEVDVPGSHLKDYFETRGYVTVFDPLAIPAAAKVT